MFDDQKQPPAQPDIVIYDRGASRKIIAEVKYKDRPSRDDINQAIAYALSYRTDQVILVHQNSPGTPTGLRCIGMIGGINVLAYAFDLASPDLDSEEQAFAGSLFKLALPPVSVGVP